MTADGGRPADVARLLRGAAYDGSPDTPYPRFDPRDMTRIPVDTWQCARIPAGVRLEMTGDASALEIDYTTDSDDLGYRGKGAGTTFSAWRGDTMVDEQPAELGKGTVRVVAGAPASATLVVYLPEGMRPTLHAVRAVGGTIEPAPRGPRWVAYGDSILEGWVASGPASGWGAVAARRHGLDLVNLGYAGSARGEIPCAEAVAALAADVISISHGTNCWTRIPHSAAMMRAQTDAFLDIVRQGHPHTPMVVTSPVLRPDAEQTPNRLGATLADLRRAMEEAAVARVEGGDDALVLVRGAEVITAAALPDGIHPDDAGHARLAEVFGGAVAAAVRGGS